MPSATANSAYPKWKVRCISTKLPVSQMPHNLGDQKKLCGIHDQDSPYEHIISGNQVGDYEHTFIQYYDF